MSSERKGFTRGRRSAASLSNISAADVIELQKSASQRKKKLCIEFLTQRATFIAWLVWMMVGTLFYCYHDDFGWQDGFFQCVNVGWAIGANVPHETDEYDNVGSRIFSIIHNSVGVMFSSIAVLHIAQLLVESREDWIVAELENIRLGVAAEYMGGWGAMVISIRKHKYEFRTLAIFLVFAMTGGLAAWMVVDEWSVAEGFDFVLSTLTCAGYIVPPSGSAKWKYSLMGLYATTGVPLLNISLGLLMTMFLEDPDSKALYSKIVADVSPQELEQLTNFGLEDGDGWLDMKEFILLISLRVGAVDTSLVSLIADKFRELDRRNEQKISYDDIVFGRRANSFVNVTSSSTVVPDPERSPEPGAGRVQSVEDILEKRREEVRRSTHTVGIVSIAKIMSHRGGTSTSPKGGGDPQKTAVVHPFSGESTASLSQDSRSAGGPRGERNTSSVTPETISGEVASDSSGVGALGGTQEDTRCSVEAIEGSGGIIEDTTSTEEGVSGKSHSFKAAVGTVQVTSKLAKRLSKAHLQELRRVSSRNVDISAHRQQSEKCGAAVVLLHRVWKQATLLAMDPYVQGFCVWLGWIVAGAFFFAYTFKESFARGLYHSVNAGYAIFWTIPQLNTVQKLYTVLHLAVGSSMVGLAMAAFAQALLNDNSEWYATALTVKTATGTSTQSRWVRARNLVVTFIASHKVIVAFVVWLIIGIVFGHVAVGWSLLDSMYFSIAAMTTGGMKSLPEGSADWKMALAGVYAAIGVPIMAIAGGGIAHEISSTSASKRLEEQITSQLTEEEFVMMKYMGIEDDDGFVDKGEYIILILVRMGLLKPDFLRVIMTRFRSLDVRKEGAIRYADMTNVYSKEEEGGEVVGPPPRGDCVEGV